jgi:hypothetical protein
MSDPFKIEEEPESIPNPDFVPSNEGSVSVKFDPDGTGQVIEVENPPVGWKINPAWVALEGAPETLGNRPVPTVSELNRSAKIHHSTLKKRDKTTINCRLKRENAEWLRSVAPKGPGGALEIGSVLDGIVERARESGGAS